MKGSAGFVLEDLSGLTGLDAIGVSLVCGVFEFWERVVISKRSSTSPWRPGSVGLS